MNWVRGGRRSSDFRVKVSGGTSEMREVIARRKHALHENIAWRERCV